MLLLLALACNGPDGPGTPPVADNRLLDPQTCVGCHPDAYREWSGSMHAYAADDPVFLAMNARGQRETDGALGDFCVNCHAPMAVRTGATTDGLNLGVLPQEVKGVTCYFCHSVTAVEGTHDNPLVLAEDGAMRGGIRQPIESGAHGSVYSSLHDRDSLESAPMCGSCHDFVNANGVALERTFAEWDASVFATDALGGELTCGECHMAAREGQAAQVADAPIRTIHAHTFAAVDVALTDWPEKDAQRALIETDLSSVLLSQLCVEEGSGGAWIASVLLENIAAGHAWPSGSAQDRRGWVEIEAWQGDTALFGSGAAADDQSLDELDDPYLWQFRDRMYGEDGEEVHMFWEAFSVESALLPTRAVADLSDLDTHKFRVYPIPSAPDRVTMRVRLRPMGVEVLEDLVASGDLDPSVIAAMPVFDLGGTVLEWNAGDPRCVPEF